MNKKQFFFRYTSSFFRKALLVILLIIPFNLSACAILEHPLSYESDTYKYQATWTANDTTYQGFLERNKDICTISLNAPSVWEGAVFTSSPAGVTLSFLGFDRSFSRDFSNLFAVFSLLHLKDAGQIGENKYEKDGHVYTLEFTPENTFPEKITCAGKSNIVLFLEEAVDTHE